MSSTCQPTTPTGTQPHFQNLPFILEMQVYLKVGWLQCVINIHGHVVIMRTIEKVGRPSSRYASGQILLHQHLAPVTQLFKNVDETQPSRLLFLVAVSSLVH